jgi:hypothetical protein
VHHVRARTLRFACGGDDYLYFVLFHGSFKVRAIASPATALAAAAAAIACAAVGMLCSSCGRHHAYPLPMGLAGCGLLLDTRAALGG